MHHLFVVGQLLSESLDESSCIFVDDVLEAPIDGRVDAGVPGDLAVFHFEERSRIVYRTCLGVDHWPHAQPHAVAREASSNPDVPVQADVNTMIASSV